MLVYFGLFNLQTLLEEWIAIRAAENGITVSKEVIYSQFPFTTIFTFIRIDCPLFEESLFEVLVHLLLPPKSLSSESRLPNMLLGVLFLNSFRIDDKFFNTSLLNFSVLDFWITCRRR